MSEYKIRKVGTIKNANKGVVVKDFHFDIIGSGNPENPYIFIGPNSHREKVVIAVNRIA